MPFLRLTLNTVSPLPAAQARALAVELRDLMATVLNKKPELTSVLVECAPAVAWTVGDDQPAQAAHLDVVITQGTNSEDEKAAFLDQAMSTLRIAMPDLSEATYIVLSEVPATDWGYDGRSQLSRRLEAEASGRP